MQVAPEPKSINHRWILGLFLTLTLSKPTRLPCWFGSLWASLPGRRLSTQPTCSIVLCSDSLRWGNPVGYSLAKFIQKYFTILDICLDTICFLFSRFKMIGIVVNVKYMDYCNPILTMVVEIMCNTSSTQQHILFWCSSLNFFALTQGNCDLSTVWVVVGRSLCI
jgi:hypothetical protein